MSARRILRSFVLIAGLLGVGVAFWARFIEPKRLKIVHLPISLPRNHAALDGMTIAFVTDTHVGPGFDAASLEPVAKHLEASPPDLVLFGGDYICESPRFMDAAAPMLGRIARTGKLGALAVLGNHDLSNIRSRIQEPLEEQGITVLTNMAQSVQFGEGTLWVAGVDDALLGKPELETAFAAVPPGAAVVCLWHVGDLAEKAVPFGPFLQLSGHSHGGQVRLPVLGALATPKLGRRYVRGLYQVDEMDLYVSSGLGVYRPPVRLNCPPELTIIHLVS